MRHAGAQQLVEHPADDQVGTDLTAVDGEGDLVAVEPDDQVEGVDADDGHAVGAEGGKENVMVFVIDVVAQEHDQGAVGVERVVEAAAHGLTPCLRY